MGVACFRFGFLGAAAVACRSCLRQQPGWIQGSFFQCEKLTSPVFACPHTGFPFIHVFAATPLDSEYGTRDEDSSKNKRRLVIDESAVVETPAQGQTESNLNVLRRSPPSKPASRRGSKTRSAPKSATGPRIDLADFVVLRDRGAVTLGELALSKLRKDAAELRAHWSSRWSNIARTTGWRMVHQKRPPSLKTVLRWIDIISKKYDEGARVHLQQAARLDRRVADVEAKLTAAHVKVPAAPRPPSQDIECPRTLRDASDYGDATKTTADSAEFATQCLRLGIQQLKKEAADLKAKWKDQQVFIAQSLATNVAFHSAPSASMRQTKKWAWAATACYKLFAPARLRDAVQNEAKARQAEQWLAEGIFDATRAVRLPCSNTRRAGLTGTSDPRRVSPDSSRQEPSEDMQQHDGEASAPPASSASSCPSEDINLRGTLLASTAYHAGDIPITYGELAVRKMRKTARQLLRTWTNKDTFVYQHVAQRMLREEIRDLDSDELDRWRRRAARTYSEGWRYRIRNATDMLIDAANLEARLAAAGVAIRTSPSTNADDTEARGPSTTEFLPGSLTFAELAVEKLRHDASEIRHVWGRGRDTYVAQRVADHMVHQKHPAPHPAAVRQLTKSAVATYKRESRGKLRLALKMETEADQVEKEVAAARERARSERRSPTQSALRGKERRPQQPSAEFGFLSAEEDPGEGPSSVPPRQAHSPLPLWLSRLDSVQVSRRLGPLVSQTGMRPTPPRSFSAFSTTSSCTASQRAQPLPPHTQSSAETLRRTASSALSLSYSTKPKDTGSGSDEMHYEATPQKLRRVTTCASSEAGSGVSPSTPAHGGLSSRQSTIAYGSVMPSVTAPPSLTHHAPPLQCPVTARFPMRSLPPKKRLRSGDTGGLSA